MSEPTPRPASPAASPTTDERFSRFGLIGWWDQARVADARVVVVGAGALGNEVLKNLALLGVGQVVVIDFDHVERSNLSRAVLFREADAGRLKADVVAAAAADLYPAQRVRPLTANVVHDIGLGLFGWADVVIGALDNREARLAINRYCYRVGAPWVDGAIEVLAGVARVFVPDGPCYECTMTDTDWQLLEQRRSCSLLNRQLIEAGHVPTTPTMASIVAAIQVQEAIKLLHEMPTLADGGFVVDGHEHTSYRVAYQRNPDCLSHVGELPLVEAPLSAASATPADVLAAAAPYLGPGAVLELPREQAATLDCQGCGEVEEVYCSLSQLDEARGLCPRCGERRAPRLFHTIRGDEPWADRPLAQLGVPAWDVLTARRGARQVAVELAADGPEVLGPALASTLTPTTSEQR